MKTVYQQEEEIEDFKIDLYMESPKMCMLMTQQKKVLMSAAKLEF